MLDISITPEYCLAAVCSQSFFHSYIQATTDLIYQFSYLRAVDFPAAAQ